MVAQNNETQFLIFFDIMTSASLLETLIAKVNREKLGPN